MEAADDFFPLMISDVDDIVFGVYSIAVIVERHLARFAADVPRFQVMEKSSAWNGKNKSSFRICRLRHVSSGRWAGLDVRQPEWQFKHTGEKNKIENFIHILFFHSANTADPDTCSSAARQLHPLSTKTGYVCFLPLLSFFWYIFFSFRLNINKARNKDALHSDGAHQCPVPALHVNSNPKYKSLTQSLSEVQFKWKTYFAYLCSWIVMVCLSCLSAQAI